MAEGKGERPFGEQPLGEGSGTTQAGSDVGLGEEPLGEQPLGEGPGAVYVMVANMNIGGLYGLSPLTISMNQGITFATASVFSQGGARNSTINQALMQAAALGMQDSVNAQQIITIGAQAGLDPTFVNTMTVSLAFACGHIITDSIGLNLSSTVALGGDAGLTEATAIGWRVAIALGQQADLTLAENMSRTLVSSLFVQPVFSTSANFLQTIMASLAVQSSFACSTIKGFELTISLAHEALASAAMYQGRTITMSLPQSAWLVDTALRDATATYVLTQSAAATTNTRRDAIANGSLASAVSFLTNARLNGQMVTFFTLGSNFAALADVLVQTGLSISLAGGASISPVQQFTAIGQATLASQAILTHAMVGVYDVVASIINVSTVADFLTKTYTTATDLSASGSVSVLTDHLRAYLIAVGIESFVSLSETARANLIERVVSDVLAAFQAQQSAQLGVLTELGVKPGQAIAATASMQMLTLLSIQTLLTEAAQNIGAEVPDVIKIVNTRLLQAILASGRMK